MTEEMLTLDKFEEASEVVRQVTQETKLVYSSYLSAQTGNKVYLKPENMQFTGAYKVRGAYYIPLPVHRRGRMPRRTHRRTELLPPHSFSSGLL